MVTLIHTTDLHNRLDERVAERLRELRDAHPDAVLLDSGDALRAGNALFHPLGEPVLERMGRLGYAAMGMGNREFHILPSWMRRKLRQASFPIVASNLVPKGDTPPCFAQSAIVETMGARVGILAVMTPMVRAGTFVDRFCGFRFRDPVEAARDTAARLSMEADLVVALTHCDPDSALAIAALPEVTITLAGHTHELGVGLADPDRDPELTAALPRVTITVGDQTTEHRADLASQACIVFGGSHARVASVIRLVLSTGEADVRTVGLRAV